MKIILASGSPRRKELLAQAGYEFEIEVSDAEENIKETAPAKLVCELASRKGEAVAGLHEKDSCIVVAADTVVSLDGNILGKPENEEDAENMLASLSGRIHQVYTGEALFLVQNGQITERQVFYECTDVKFRPLNKEEISRYIATGEPMDKAGAYGIQGKAAVFISGIRGDYYNVVGLPVCRTACELEKMIAKAQEDR